MWRRGWFASVGVPVLAVLSMGAAGLSIARNATDHPPLPPQITPPIAPMTLESIGAIGIVEAASEQIAIATALPGLVASVPARPGMTVHAGDVLLTIDSRRADADVAAARADVAAAQARLAQAQGLLPGLRAAMATAAAQLAEVEAARADALDLARSGELSILGTSITQREMTRRRNDVAQALARVAQGQARLAQARADLAQYEFDNGEGPALAVARAGVAQARAALETATVDQDRLTVRAPIDGTVLQVNIRAGEFASAGVIAPGLIVLARLSPLHVRVEIDEADLARFAPGRRAWGFARGDGDHRASLSLLHVDPLVVPKISLTGLSGDRVDTRVLRVVYQIDDPLTRVYVGQQMDVYIEAGPPDVTPKSISRAD